ncbi:MAG: hypothetical protein JSW27_17760 [Phycisphaerales bacterium]|nr:MAG: hypothetical protein JSW27_17760 [Phycisphaerales bacterium]
MKIRNTLVMIPTIALLFAGCQSPSQGRYDDNISAMHLIKQLALGCYMHAQDNAGTLPSTMTDLKPYVDESFDPDAYDLVVSGRLSDIENPGETVLIRRKRLLRDDQQAVAFADGHAAIIPAR